MSGALMILARPALRIIIRLAALQLANSSSCLEYADLIFLFSRGPVWIKWIEG